MKLKFSCQLFLTIGLIFLSTVGTQQAWAGPAATSTALTVTSGGKAVATIASGSQVTLTAAVVFGSTKVTTGQVNFHARVAANVLRTVERELLDAGDGEARAALTELGFGDEAALAAAIRAGELDARPADVTACLRTLVRHRLAVAHPGYECD